MSGVEKSILDNLKLAVGSAFPVIMEHYIKFSNESIDVIEKALAEGNREELHITAHSMKSSSMQVGASKLSELVGEMESKAEATTDGMEGLFHEIKEEHQQVMQYFSEEGKE